MTSANSQDNKNKDASAPPPAEDPLAHLLDDADSGGSLPPLSPEAIDPVATPTGIVLVEMERPLSEILADGGTVSAPGINSLPKLSEIQSRSGSGSICCPHCHCPLSTAESSHPVSNTRHVSGAVRRYRTCGNPRCGKSFRTTERVD